MTDRLGTSFERKVLFCKRAFRQFSKQTIQFPALR